jgi:hypothetical protein
MGPSSPRYDQGVPWFQIAYAQNAFLRVLKAKGWNLKSLSPQQGNDAMLEFYRDYRPQHGGEDAVEVSHDAGAVSITRHMTRRDTGATHVLTLTIDDDGGRLTLS